MLERRNWQSFATLFSVVAAASCSAPQANEPASVASAGQSANSSVGGSGQTPNAAPNLTPTGGNSSAPANSTHQLAPFPPLPSAAPAVCTVGMSEACTCNDGMPGSRVCVSPTGQFSACGCVSLAEPALYVPKPPPVVHQCGNTTCAPYPEEDTEVGAKHCCTAEGACGSQSKFIFGAACIRRGADPGLPSATCPGETPDFLDLTGCCRPDGQCGLSIDQVNNWDAGCIERTQMASLLNAGSADRDLLTALSFRAVKQADYRAMACSAK